ncbi:unnamed protein product [Prorocentrum cordatum]|uniref:Uncharacterized protein n=1 Tax=Prorocentrum cordatum TaxID=2364126 RepID=A0ABN9W1J6_9DINO|nr:unnamed protein product [Polarella glacialis]
MSGIEWCNVPKSPLRTTRLGRAFGMASAAAVAPPTAVDSEVIAIETAPVMSPDRFGRLPEVGEPGFDSQMGGEAAVEPAFADTEVEDDESDEGPLIRGRAALSHTNVVAGVKQQAIEAVDEMVKQIQELSSTMDEGTLAQHLKKLFKSDAQQVLMAAKRGGTAPETDKTTIEVGSDASPAVQAKAAMWAEVQAQGFNFSTKGTAGNKIAGVWQRHLDGNVDNVKTEYGKCKGRDAQRAFRKQWAEGKFNAFKSEFVKTEKIDHEWAKKSKMVSLSRMAWKYGGGKEGWRSASCHAGKCIQLGAPFVEYEESSETLLYAYIERSFNERFTQTWANHQSWLQAWPGVGV